MPRLALALALVSVLAGAAAAQTDTDTTDLIAMGGDYTYDTWPLALARRPLLTAPGLLELGARLGVSLSSGALFKPVTLGESVRYGASDHFTIVAANDPGICLGARASCPHYEENLSVGVLVGLLGDAGSPLQVAAVADAHVDTFSPLAVGVRLGAPTRVLLPGVAVELDDAFTIVLNGPDAHSRERLELPLEVEVQLTGRLALLLDTGFLGPISSLRKQSVVPLAAGFEHTVGRGFDLGARFGFPNLLGGGGTARARSVDFFVKYRR